MLLSIKHLVTIWISSFLFKNLEFPFLVLLLSGGHCLLAVAKKVNEFFLLGQSIDDAPGEALDKVFKYHLCYK